MTKTTIKKDDSCPENLPVYQLLVSDINEKFLQLVWDTLEEQGRKITCKLIGSVVETTKKYKREVIFSADGSEPESLWDDYCAQKQSGELPGFRKQQELISGICFNEVIDLKLKNKDQHNILTLYLSQSSFNYSERTLDDSELAEFFFSEVNSFALNYTNKQIVEFIER